MNRASAFPTPASLAIVATLTLAACSTSPAAGPQAPATSTDAATPAPAPGTTTYQVYVAAESADLLHRIRFDGTTAEVVNTVHVGELPDETDGPHGLRVSPDGATLYMTTAHGLPDGRLWKLATGADSVMGRPVELGRFPATLDLTPDGLYAFVANFNLHGAHEPSTISTVFTPDGVEVAQTETCVMPHGARIHPDGLRLYSACMMDNVLVELDTRTLEVSRQLDLGSPCAPTWTLPSPRGDVVYVACNGADRVLEIDVGDWSVERTLQTGAGPYNLAVSADGTRLVVTLKKEHAVQIIDLADPTAGATTATSTTIPHGVVLSPDGRYAFVSVEGVGVEPGRVDVFDLDTHQRIATAEVGQQAGGIAFWKMEVTPP